MKITVESTTKFVQLNGVPARIWEGTTEDGIAVHVYITRIAHGEDEPEDKVRQFKEQLVQTRKPSAAIESLPTRMIL